jgi:hypothetical protein
MVAMYRTQCGGLRSCSERRPAIASTPRVFGHSHAIVPAARCSFLLWAQELKSYVAGQTL